MAVQHYLSLEIPDVSDERVFIVHDTSIYASDLIVSCATLQITSPGFNDPVVLGSISGTSIRTVLNACTLGIIRNGCDETPPKLQDGLYQIHYSLSPNDRVFVAYDHLRISNTKNRIHKLMCSLNVGFCEPSADVKEKLKEIRLIQSLVALAKAKVEDCHYRSEGMEVFRYALKRLKKMEKGCDNC